MCVCVCVCVGGWVVVCVCIVGVSNSFECLWYSLVPPSTLTWISKLVLDPLTSSIAPAQYRQNT